ncbi:MAG: hypothetical protein RLY58_1070 [Pseudomonadota bacterium]|jgi:uncharacterized metal-binding protein (TIGR02443 family)
MSLKKRFIAGAKCTQCNAVDRVMMLITDDDEWIECVDCGYTERRPTEVVTRDPDAEAAAKDSTGVVQFRPMR